MTDLYAVRDFNYYAEGLTGPPDPYTPSVTGNPYHYLSGTMRGSQSIYETNESDNFFYKVISILPPPSPDLVVTHISHPTNAFSGSDIAVQWTVANQGTSLATGGWYDDVYIQMGSELNMAEARRLAHVKHNGGLATDSSYQASATVHLPINYAGTYNIFVVTDISDSVYESIYENNNTTASSQSIEVVMAPLADLTVTNVTMPATLSPRCNYPVSWTVTNAGAAATEKSQWRDALYLSTAPTYDASAVFLKYENHYGVIGIDSSYSATSTITIPATLTGSYYLIVRTDYLDSIFEYLNEDNNTGASTSPSQIVLSDLVVSSVQFENSISIGDTLHVQTYIKNIGQGTAYGYLNTRFNISGTPVSKGVQCNLAPGDSLLVTCLLKQTCISTAQGELTIQTNWDNQILESNTANNTKTVAYEVNRADLTATTINYADTGWSGTQMPVTILLSNIGTLAVNDTVSLAMYISSSNTTYTANAANRVLDSRERMSLTPDSSITLTRTVTLPNGIEGDYYLHLVIDPTNKICESNEGNNVTHGNTLMHVNLSPYPDLIVRNLNVPDTMSVGQTVTFDVDIINQGIAAAQGVLTTKVFMSLSGTWGSAPHIEVATLEQSVNIDVNDTLPCVVTGIIPTNANAGFYYFYAVTDYNDAFYEHTGESNNRVRSAQAFVKLYPLDLQIDSISGPATMDWGQQATYTLTITNHTTVPTSAPRWVDRLYVSQDGSIQANMANQEQNHTTVLLPGESYQVSFEVTIPFGSPSTLYLVGICDYNRSNPDIDVSNNQFVRSITINAVPTPDLQVSDVAILGNVVSGQPFQLVYTVTNVSATPVVQGHWADRVSMSYVAALNSTSQQLTLTPKEMSLAAGESYRDTVEVTVPVPNQGSRFLLVQTNAQLNFYETVQDNNVVAVPVTITLPPPGDLVVSRIVMPDTMVSGRRAQFQWAVANIGANDISGRGLSSLLYLSGDDVFDANDRLLGRANVEQISLASGDSVVQQLTARISSVSEGNYYLIAKTDVRNAFYEDNENNNNTVSVLPFYVKVRELPFNTPLVDTLYNGEPNDYKLNVGTHRNETVRLHVESDDSLHGAVNMVYVSHNRVGDNLSYNFSTIGQYTANPELYIPSTHAGYYGVSLYGSVPSDSMQVVTVTADILPFELRSINPDEGGTGGDVTIELNGSRFRPDMKVWMLKDGDTLFADTLIYSSYYQAFARFDLKDADTGYYSMGVLNYCEGEAMLTDVFHVTEESPDGLAYHMVFPNSPRPNRTISMMLEFGNTGNTDIVAPVLEVQSVGGTYISLTVDGLAQQTTTLRIPLSIEGEPEGLLRPGSYGTITIYGYTAGTLVFAIKQVQ
jgi:subtilase family serine protease